MKGNYNMYKIIACDLDETLLNDNAIICQRNKEAIQKAIEHGVKFVPATGRGYRSTQDILEELNLKDMAAEYVISFNGACLTENKDNTVLNFEGLTWETAEKLFELGQKYDVCIHVYSPDVLYVYHVDEDELNYIRLRYNFKIIDDQKNLEFLKGQKIPKVIYGSTDSEYLHQIAEELGSITDDLDVSYSSNRYMEFNKKGINKGSGLKKLAQKLGVSMDETIALGDNFNDLSMIQAAGLGIGMNNTNPKMKQECDYITEADNNQGGVAEAIEHFVLK